jgi:hypothetical protein
MAGLKLNTSDVNNAKLGTVNVSKLYMGTTLIKDFVVLPTGKLFTHAQTSTIKELNLTNMSVLRSGTESLSTGYGIGGYSTDKLYFTNGSTTVRIINLTTLNTSTTITTSTGTYGMEGTDTRLFRGTTTYIREVDPQTHLDLTTNTTNTRSLGRDIGCTLTRLYSKCDPSTSTNAIQEYDMNTLTVLSSASEPSGANSTAAGIGGTETRLFATDQLQDRIYELDVNTKAPVNSWAFSTNPTGIGGTKVTPV